MTDSDLKVTPGARRLYFDLPGSEGIMRAVLREGAPDPHASPHAYWVVERFQSETRKIESSTICDGGWDARYAYLWVMARYPEAVLVDVVR